MTATQIYIWAITGWMESRSEPLDGRRGVMHAIWNRLHSGKWYGGQNVIEVCWRPLQFSCWNSSDHNRMFAAALPETDPTLAMFTQIADAIIAGTDLSPVADATHYVNPKAVTRPDWATPDRRICVIADHEFYGNVP